MIASALAHSPCAVHIADGPLDQLRLAVEHERLVAHDEAARPRLHSLAARHAARSEAGPLGDGALRCVDHVPASVALVTKLADQLLLKKVHSIDSRANT